MLLSKEYVSYSLSSSEEGEQEELFKPWVEILEGDEEQVQEAAKTLERLLQMPKQTTSNSGFGRGEGGTC